MDIYDFMDSKTVGGYCREIGHRFTAVQEAYLINKSFRHTLNEKRQAFRYIIEHMPDEETNSYVFSMDKGEAGRVGIHWLLSRYMEIQDKYLEEFFRNGEHPVYEYRIYHTGEEYREDGYFHKIDDVFSAIDSADFFHEDEAQIRVYKYRTDGSGKSIAVFFNRKKEVMDIDMEGAWEMSEEEQDIVYGINGVCFVCPVPFKKGDIVYAPFQGGEPFVLEHVWYEGLEEDYVAKYSASRHCCSADMVAYGHFQPLDGGIYYECMHDYLGLEYYTGPLEGKKRSLKAVSNYLKGEINLTLALNAYYLIMGEEEVRMHRKRMNITDEGMRLAGLLEE